MGGEVEGVGYLRWRVLDLWKDDLSHCLALLASVTPVYPVIRLQSRALLPLLATLEDLPASVKYELSKRLNISV